MKSKRIRFAPQCTRTSWLYPLCSTKSISYNVFRTD